MQRENNNELERKQIEKLWDSVAYQDVKNEEQRLSKSLELAIEHGADPETMTNILGEWKAQRDQLQQMEKQLFDARAVGEQPDVFQKYVKDSKENLAKGMHIFTDKVKGYVDKVKSGILKGKDALTNKIKAAHANVMSVFHKKQAELGKSFTKFVDNIKEDVTYEKDIIRLDKWVKATEAAEKAEDKLNTGREKYENRVINIKDKMASKHEKNAEQFNQAVKSATAPKMGARLKAGVKTIADAVTGKDYQVYTADRPTQDAAKDLQDARDRLKNADKKVTNVGNLKLGIVKAWSKMTTAISNFKAQHYAKQADKALENLSKVQSPEVSDYVAKLQEARKSGMPMAEAVRFANGQGQPKTDAPDKDTKDKPKFDENER